MLYYSEEVTNTLLYQEPSKKLEKSLTQESQNTVLLGSCWLLINNKLNAV